ncbi:TetR/AcrR family transcriptional regulator [Planomonospora sp. ID82291]|uniref:TetR/AcrR family transcriptional regulator n=1 Tax=Planomonospora sp. ID82291 TaxID=2738136 RepID=UPI0018C40830|nr:TetR/AcrR family transcriptional regulator [Planomonospora sp. ID82291]
MALTLRQRNRLAAMHHIIETAIDLFDEHGYTAVTVEQVAAAAGVSPRTFYRYFGTKEGLFTTDTHAAIGQDLLAEQLDLDDLPGTLERIVASVHTAAAPSGGAALYTPWSGVRYVLEEPAVREAVYTALDDLSERLTAALRSTGADPTRARVAVRSYLFGVYFGALEQWHLDGRVRPLLDYVKEGSAVLAGPSGPSGSSG